MPLGKTDLVVVEESEKGFSKQRSIMASLTNYCAQTTIIRLRHSHYFFKLCDWEWNGVENSPFKKPWKYVFWNHNQNERSIPLRSSITHLNKKVILIKLPCQFNIGQSLIISALPILSLEVVWVSFTQYFLHLYLFKVGSASSNVAQQN